MTTTKKNPSFDLATSSGRKSYLQLQEKDEDTLANDLMLYLEKGIEPSIKYGKTLLFELGSGCLCLLKDDVLYRGATLYLTDDPFTHTLTSIAGIVEKDDYRIKQLINPIKENSCVIGFVIDKKITIDGRIFSKTLLRRGDQDANDLVDEIAFNFPTTSLSALAQMFSKVVDENSEKFVVSKFIKGKISIVDFIPDEFVDLTAAEKKQLHSYNNQHIYNPMLLPPIGKLGFSLMGKEWHRSSTILISDNEASYLFGQDEETYFGCQLVDNPKTVSKAFESLVPKAIRGKEYDRQGEWFIVKVKENEVPKIKDSLCILANSSSNTYSCCLPVESEDSNLHTIFVDGRFDVRLSKDGFLYAKSGQVVHNQHDEKKFEGWVKFYRNTAVKSVSAQNNVD